MDGYFYLVTNMNSSETLDEVNMDAQNLTTNITTASTQWPNRHSYLVYYMGEKRMDLPSIVALTIVYSAIFLSGIIGNVSTCIVIAKNNYMHTATNYYLFSLAMSDMLTLILGLPPELYSIWEAYPWIFGEPFCIFKSFLSEMTSYSSVLTITAFTVERYIAICHPIKSQTLSNLSRAIKIIVLIWVLACVFAIPYPIHTRIFYYLSFNGSVIEESLQCNIPQEWRSEMFIVFQISTFVFFLLPMAVITIMYILIGRSLSKNNFGESMNSNQSTTKAKARKAVIKMLVAVVVAFFFCWAPFHAQRLMTSYIKEKDWTPLLIKIQSNLFYISGVLYFFGSTVNPILYNLMSKKFRVAFKRTLCRCCYSVDELIELSGRSKSVMYSDKSPMNLRRCQLYNSTTTTHVQALRKSKSGSELVALKHCNGQIIPNRLTVCSNLCNQWDNHGLERRLNGLIPDGKSNGSTPPSKSPSPRRFNISSCSLLKLASQSSVVSFPEVEQELSLELKSFNSQTQLYPKENVLIRGESNFKSSTFL